MERLPLRLQPELEHLFPADKPGIGVTGSDGRPPRLTGALRGPLSGTVTFTVRVHSQVGIPIATSRVTASSGAERFESDDLAFIGMEGYAHLSRPALQAVQERIWKRRSFATAALVRSGLDL